MKQKDLAATCGVSPGVVSEWIGKNRVPEPPRLIKLSRALDASIDYLLTGHEPAGADTLIAGIERLLEQAEALRRGGQQPVEEAEPDEEFPDAATG